MHNGITGLTWGYDIWYIVSMYIARAKWESKNGKVYESVWLRQSYREGGQVKTRNVANLKHCRPEEVDAIELALKYKGDLAVLGSRREVKLKEGLSVGAVWTVYEVARRLGIDAGKLALWQVLARVIDQGSRLSAVRLAQLHAACDVLGMRRGFDENDLYENLAWLSERQAAVERAERRGDERPELFLYDVTSSYLEGEKNAFGAYGYPRDGKKGKKQIVIGLLCDERGEPVSTEVFKGNTQDPATFGSQVRKAVEVFGCERVTFVGDRGMVKSAQIEQLAAVGFHYIGAITKPQIETLLTGGILQMELFDEKLCEVEHEGVRYILRRNPMRAAELAASRADKRARVEQLVEERNRYLAEHPRAKVATAQRIVREKIVQLNIARWLSVNTEGRALSLGALEHVSRLDGCYVIKTDLPKKVAGTQTIHDRYKDLSLVEQAFRTCKTAHLEVRPIYVRNKASTRGHVLVVMLAYFIRRELSRAWTSFDFTVEEGLERLKTLCAMEVKFQTGVRCLKLPEPRDQSLKMLKALGIRMPHVLPKSHAHVRTHKKLQKRRKTR